MRILLERLTEYHFALFLMSKMDYEFGIFSLAWSVLWTAHCTYFTLTGVEYAQITNQLPDAVLSKFFGTFFMLFMSGYHFIIINLDTFLFIRSLTSLRIFTTCAFLLLNELYE